MIGERFTLGSDPEFCGYDIIRNKPVSLIGLLGGTKEEPKPIDVPGCFIQEDNVNAEFTIVPSTNYFTLVDTIRNCINYTNNILSHKNIELRAYSSSIYDENELNNEKAMEFGCDPSYCAYTSNITEVPSPEEVGNIRSAGFHIHFGWNEHNISVMEYLNFIKLCDAFLGVPSLFYDDDDNRRKIYGSLGDFRLQKWGIEYRTLGAAMFEQPEIVNHGINCIKNILSKNLLEKFVDQINDDLRKLYFERSENYKSKQLVWNKISYLYTGL